MNSRRTLASRIACQLALMLALSLVVFPCDATEPDASGWRTLEPGLDLGTFTLDRLPRRGDPTAVILRVDPSVWRLTIRTVDDAAGRDARSIRDWCEREGLVAGINAGMFDLDWRTHVGFLQTADGVNAATVNHYESLAVMEPRIPGLPGFRIVDRDGPGSDLDRLRTQYACVVQNLRLVKRPRVNRWTPQEKSWSETALGEDGAGRALFIFTGGAYTMHDLVEALLALPIDLVGAQHLDGGAAAQLFVAAGGVEQEWIGTYETGVPDRNPAKAALRIPFVLGVARRDQSPLH